MEQVSSTPNARCLTLLEAFKSHATTEPGLTRPGDAVEAIAPDDVSAPAMILIAPHALFRRLSPLRLANHIAKAHNNAAAQANLDLSDHDAYNEALSARVSDALGTPATVAFHGFLPVEGLVAIHSVRT